MGELVGNTDEIWKYGRFKLSKAQPARILDLCSGMGTFPYAWLNAGLCIASYHTVEINGQARNVFRNNTRMLDILYGPQLTTGAFQQFDERLPQDLYELSEQRAVCWKDWPELPNMVVMTAPCVGGSRAGRGQGAATVSGRTYIPGLEVMTSLYKEYERRGQAEPTLAPFGWIVETAPPSQSDRRPGVVQQ